MPVSADLPSCGGHLVTVDGRALPLRSTRLSVRASGGLATVKVVQTFANPYAEVLQVRYLLPLPAEAAVAGFAFTLGDRRIEGAIERRAVARDRFEQALAEGHTAGLLEQERSALFAQELGNVPAGASVQAEIDVDQMLAWHDGGWDWRFPTTVAPRYQGGPGRVPDAVRIDVPVADGALAVRLQVELHVDDDLAVGGVVRSPSHALRVDTSGARPVVHIVDAPLDRDVVVRWQVASPGVGAAVQCARPAAGALAAEAHGLLTLVPPQQAPVVGMPRDLVVLLDISGSMQGQPLAAAQAITAALVRSLTPADRLELVAFADRPRPWLGAPCFATEGNRDAALKWLAALQASGGTEMRAAILAALQPLRDGAQRQVVLVTDGQIGFEAEITAAILHHLPASSRVHVVGVGSAPNRSLTRSAARAGHGLEVLVGLDEDPAPAVQRLLARTVAPLVTGLAVGGSAVRGVHPRALPDLFAGAPVRLALQLRPEGGDVVVTGVTAAGPFRRELSVAASERGAGAAAVSRLCGREWIEDLEAQLAGGGDVAGTVATIERLGMSFGLATRATSWLAIDERVGVDPQQPRRVVAMPHALPHGMSCAGLGLRPAMVAAASADAIGFSCEVAPACPAPAGQRFRVQDKEHETLKQPAPAEKRKRALSPAESVPAVAASLRTRSVREWVFDITGMVEWRLPDRVVLVFADGSECTARVEKARSTVGGPVAPGLTVRLVVDGAGLLPVSPVALRLGLAMHAEVVPIA
ncbi:MAG: VWA domain-containing protein [Planctomycetes bacterium]|nr:VWA domain-containing protein [Planctomycetota bacterium]